MRVLLLTLAIFACSAMASAKLKVLVATKQQWSGGVAGRSGCNFRFQLQYANREGIKLDSVWLNGFVFPCILPNTVTGEVGNCTIETHGKNTVCTILVTTQHDEYADRRPMEGGGAAQKSTVPPIKFEGVACFGYTQKGMHKYLAVKAFTQVAKPVNYP